MIRVYSVDVAMEIGDRPATVVSQIKYWFDKGYGVTIDGVKYIYNTYEQWHKEQFPYWSLNTVKNIFKKLKELNIVIRLKARSGWDHTSYWTLNYSHPIVQKLVSHRPKIGLSDSTKIGQSLNTNTYPKKTTNTTSVVLQNDIKDYDPSTNRARSKRRKEKTRDRGKSTSEDYKKAKAWLVGLDEIDRGRIEKYIKNQMNNPKIINPIGYEREVTSQVWRKHMGMDNHCDFVVTMGTVPKLETRHELVYLTDEQKVGAEITFDEEMALLQGEL